jgi:hypothetical protein
MKVCKLRRKKFYQIGHQVEDDVSEDKVGEPPLRADAEEVVLVGGIDLPAMSICIYNCKWKHLQL